MPGLIQQDVDSFATAAVRGERSGGAAAVTLADPGGRTARTALVLSLLFFTACHLPFLKVLFPSDEGDNLLAGWLMAQGKVPYRDFFSQHAPFGYLYSALFELVFGRNWVAHRYSVALLGLLALGYALARSMKGPDRRLFYGVAFFTVLWPFYSVLYWGYMLLSDNLAAYATLLPLLLIANCLWNHVRLTKADNLVLGIAAYVAVFANPYMMFPLAALLPLYTYLLWPPREPPVENALSPWRSLFAAAVGFGVPAGLTGFYFYWTCALREIWDCVVVFNTQVYAKYGCNVHFREAFLGQAKSFLQVWGDVPWDFRPWYPDVFNDMGNDWWAYLGLAGRLSVLVLCGFCLVTRKRLLGLALYAFAAALLLRVNNGFHAQPFRMLEVFCVALLLALTLWAVLAAPRLRYRATALLPLFVLVGSNAVVLAKSVQTVYTNGLAFTLHADRRNVPPSLKQIFSEALGQDGQLLCYPVCYQTNYLCGYKPASYFYACVPWTVERRADVDRIVADLHRAAAENTVLLLGRTHDIWGNPFEYFGAEVFAAVERDYVEVLPDFFVPRGHPFAKRGAVKSVPFPVRPSAVRDMNWSDGAGVAQGSNPQLEFKLEKPVYVHRVEVKMVLTNQTGGPALFRGYWRKSDAYGFGDGGRVRACSPATGPQERTLSIPVNETIDQFRIDPDNKPCRIEIRSITLVE